MSENTERDELADIIKREYRSAVTRKSDDCYTAPADAILAAGYRKPRTITTIEELRDLPVQSVIRGKWTAEKWADELGELWYVAGKGMRWDTEQLVQRGALPATVLFEASL